MDGIPASRYFLTKVLSISILELSIISIIFLILFLFNIWDVVVEHLFNLSKLSVTLYASFLFFKLEDKNNKTLNNKTPNSNSKRGVKKICLTMIVKNESKNMVRLLNSLIDVIVGAMIVAISDNCDDYDDF